MAEESKTKKVLMVILIILLVSIAAQLVEYAKIGWEGVNQNVREDDLLTIKWIFTGFFIVAIILISIGVITGFLIKNEDAGGCILWIFSNIFHFAAIPCIWTGILSSWVINLILGILVLIQGFGSLIVGTGFSQEAGSDDYGCLSILIISVYHLFFVGIFAARIYYHFSG